MARPLGSNGREAARLKAAVLAAFDKVGGAEYLVKQSAENPNAFIALLAKILPRDVNHGGQPDNPIVTEDVHARIRILAARIGIVGSVGEGKLEANATEVPTVH